MEFFKEFFKNLLRNRWSNFEIISQDCSLGDLFKNFSGNFNLSKYMAAMGEGFLHCVDLKKFFSETVGQNLE